MRVCLHFKTCMQRTLRPMPCEEECFGSFRGTNIFTTVAYRCKSYGQVAKKAHEQTHDAGAERRARCNGAFEGGDAFHIARVGSVGRVGGVEDAKGAGVDAVIHSACAASVRDNVGVDRQDVGCESVEAVGML